MIIVNPIIGIAASAAGYILAASNSKHHHRYDHHYHNNYHDSKKKQPKKTTTVTTVNKQPSRTVVQPRVVVVQTQQVKVDPKPVVENTVEVVKNDPTLKKVESEVVNSTVDNGEVQLPIAVEQKPFTKESLEDPEYRSKMEYHIIALSEYLTQELNATTIETREMQMIMAVLFFRLQVIDFGSVSNIAHLYGSNGIDELIYMNSAIELITPGFCLSPQLEKFVPIEVVNIPLLLKVLHFIQSILTEEDISDYIEAAKQILPEYNRRISLDKMYTLRERYVSPILSKDFHDPIITNTVIATVKFGRNTFFDQNVAIYNLIQNTNWYLEPYDTNCLLLQLVLPDQNRTIKVDKGDILGTGNLCIQLKRGPEGFEEYFWVDTKQFPQIAIDAINNPNYQISEDDFINVISTQFPEQFYNYFDFSGIRLENVDFKQLYNNLKKVVDYPEYGWRFLNIEVGVLPRFRFFSLDDANNFVLVCDDKVVNKILVANCKDYNATLNLDTNYKPIPQLKIICKDGMLALFIGTRYLTNIDLNEPIKPPVYISPFTIYPNQQNPSPRIIR